MSGMNGKVAVVTGASSGIGEATSRRLEDSAYRVRGRPAGRADGDSGDVGIRPVMSTSPTTRSMTAVSRR